MNNYTEDIDNVKLNIYYLQKTFILFQNIEAYLSKSDNLFGGETKRAHREEGSGGTRAPCGSSNGGEHHFVQDDLKRHRVTATAADQEELTIAMPLAIIQLDHVRVVGAVEAGGQGLDGDAVALLGIQFGFFIFTDHPTVHSLTLLVRVWY